MFLMKAVITVIIQNHSIYFIKTQIIGMFFERPKCFFVTNDCFVVFNYIIITL